MNNSQNKIIGCLGVPFPADSTLINKSKKELINMLHIAEHNYQVQAETKEEIRIIKKGRRITAAYYVDGKCVRHANTKCSKEDNFDFEYGSKLAFKRMWGDPDA